MTCPRCYQNNPPEARYCLSCGMAFLNPQVQPLTKKKNGCLIASLLFLFFVVLPVTLLSIMIIFIGVKVARQDAKTAALEGRGEDKIAVLNIDGLIVEKEASGGFGSFSEEMTSARKIKKLLSEISNDGDVKVILLRVNSPGGSAVASEEIYQELLAYKKNCGKKIVAYFSDLAASGGYYVAMAADEIVASPSTITGSIGVMISYLNFQDLADKYGVKNIVYKSGPHKDIVSEFRKPTEVENEIMQSLVDDSFGAFVRVVVNGRKLSEERVRQLADGRVYSAQQAKEIQLVDKIGTFETAILEAKRIGGLKEATVVEFGQPSFWESLMGSFSGRFNVSLLPNLGNYFNFGLGPRILYLYQPQ